MANSATYNRTLIHFAEGAAAATPDAGEVVTYAKTDGLLYSKDDAGTETLMSGGSGLSNPMTTGGDVIYGGASGTPTRLANGTAGQVLTSGGTTVAPTWETGGGGDVATDAIWTTAGKVAVATGTATATEQYPPGYELDYVAKTSSTNITATSAATADTVITGTSQAYAAGDYWVEVFAPQCRTTATANASLTFALYDGATELGLMAEVRTPAAAATGASQRPRTKVTLTAATHQLIFKAFVSGGTGIIGAGAGGANTLVPAYILVTVA
jgi:hypothetical protein